MKICLFLTVASFSLLACTLATHDVLAGPALTNREIFTEDHNLMAETILATQLFIGDVAKECGPILGESASWPKEIEAAWAKSNVRYTTSANDYLGNLISNISLVSGAKAHNTMLSGIRKEIIGISDHLFQNTLYDQNRKNQCSDTVHSIVHGDYDFAPPSQIAHLALELAKMTEALIAKIRALHPSSTTFLTK